MSTDHRLNRALRGLQRVTRETVRLSEIAPDEDERFMALYFGLRRAGQVAEKLAPHTADEDGRLASVGAAVRWWRAQEDPRPGEGADEAVREANDRMKEAIGVIGLASSDDPSNWARARSWVGSHPSPG